jgi:hypothetical protein
MNFSYTSAQICLNGHVIADNTESKARLSKFCSICGAETITDCPSCYTNIRGYYTGDNVEDWHTDKAPAYCYHCGKPYPWTLAIIEAFNEIIDFADELDMPEKTIIKEAFPSLLNDQPESSPAALKICKLLKVATNTTIIGIKAAITDKITSELFKTLMGW